MITIEISSIQEFDFYENDLDGDGVCDLADIRPTWAHINDPGSTSNRFNSMWSLSAPSLELTTSSPYIMSDISNSTNTLVQSPSVSVESNATISVNSNDLGVGQHILTIGIESSWTGISYYNINLLVFDEPNTPPEITGSNPNGFEPDSNLSLFYSLNDIDGDTLTVSLVNAPSEMTLQTSPDTIVGSGTVVISWDYPTPGNYTIEIEVSDGEDTTSLSFSFDVVIDIPDDFDIEGCMDSVAGNYNSAATIDDGSCEYPNGSDQGSQPGQGDGDSDKDGDNEESNQQSSTDVFPLILLASLTIVAIILLTVTILMVMRRKKNDEVEDEFIVNSAFNEGGHDEFSVGMMHPESNMVPPNRPSTGSPSVPPASLRGEFKDGFEWFEHPSHSGIWYYRDTVSNLWVRHE
jgi:hypothetical protein